MAAPETDTTIILTDPTTAPHSEAVCERHEGWPVHLAAECDRLADVRPYSQRIQCSVCGLDWDPRVLVSQHHSCRTLTADGRQVAARPISYWQRGGEAIEIEYR